MIVDFIPNHMGLDCAWLNDHPEYFIHRLLDASEEALSDRSFIGKSLKRNLTLPVFI